MSRRAIDRREWSQFVDGFSRRHDGWLISVAVEEGTGLASRHYVLRDVPLRGVVAVQNDGGNMMIFTGDTMPHTTHFVEQPVALAVEETTDGAESQLTIADGAGTRTIIEFRSSMPPELVDGVVWASGKGVGHET